MDHELTKEQLADLRDRLRERWDVLKGIIREELIASDEEHYVELAGQVHDLQEASVADLLVDLDLAVIDLHVQEIRRIEQALMRMDRGAYGVCADCDQPIDPARLQAHPTALRCARCQAQYEKTHAGNSHPRL